MNIKRVGAPQAVDARGEYLRVKIILNAAPDPGWVHFFREFPSEYTSMEHPALIEVDGNAMSFESAESRVSEWLRYIDRWAEDANRQYGEHLATLRRKTEQAEANDRERQRRIHEANERLKKLS